MICNNKKKKNQHKTKQNTYETRNTEGEGIGLVEKNTEKKSATKIIQIN